MFRSLLRLSKIDSTLKSINRTQFNRGIKENHSNISSSEVHNFLLNLMSEKLKPGVRVLDIGCGTGYLTACIAKLTKSDKKDYHNVIGIEHVKDLANIARQNMRELNINNTIIYNADGRYNIFWQNNLFDIINVGGSVKNLDSEILNQLAPKGVIITSLGKGYDDQKLYRITKDEITGEIIYEFITDEYMFAPLTDLNYQLSENYLFDPFKQLLINKIKY